MIWMERFYIERIMIMGSKFTLSRGGFVLAGGAMPYILLRLCGYESTAYYKIFVTVHPLV